MPQGANWREGEKWDISGKTHVRSGKVLCVCAVASFPGLPPLFDLQRNELKHNNA